MNTENNLRVLAEGKFLRLVTQSGWEWVDRTNASGAAVIAALTGDEHLVLVEQYRIPMQSRVLELPAGLAGDFPGVAGEAVIDAARRELFEETGYDGGEWRFAAYGPSSPGMSTETYSLFIVRGVQKTGPGGGEEGENIEVHVVPLAGIDAWLEDKRKSGVIIDPKIYLARWFLSDQGFRGST